MRIAENFFTILTGLFFKRRIDGISLSETHSDRDLQLYTHNDNIDVQLTLPLTNKFWSII